MKNAIPSLAVVFTLVFIALALDGQFGIHDPSTAVMCNAEFYTYGTGVSSLVSDDGWTWRAGVRPSRAGLAPDVIHIGDRYYMYVAANIGAQPKAAVNMIWSKTLDSDFPDYKWEEAGVVASSDGVEDSNGSWRIMPKSVPNSKEALVLSAFGSSFATLARFNPTSQKQRWLLKTP